MDYQRLFQDIHRELSRARDRGKVAAYIPELGNVNPDKFGVHLVTLDDRQFSLGDYQEKFSIQSISKVLALVMAYNLENERLWRRVDVEPSGTPFNSLLQLEADRGIPRNPLINAGALVVCDILIERLTNPKQDFLDFVRTVSGNRQIDYNLTTAGSEKSAGHRNRALVNLMKALGNIRNSVEDVLDFYFDLCSVEMSCEELARTFLFLAADGRTPGASERVTTAAKSKRINAIMQMCGFYDEAGEFAFRVGLPGKSGVGGGIVAVYPEEFSIAVWSPRLNPKGNSFRGMKFLEMLTTRTKASIF